MSHNYEPSTADLGWAFNNVIWCVCYNGSLIALCGKIMGFCLWKKFPETLKSRLPIDSVSMKLTFISFRDVPSLGSTNLQMKQRLVSLAMQPIFYLAMSDILHCNTIISAWQYLAFCLATQSINHYNEHNTWHIKLSTWICCKWAILPWVSLEFSG